MYSTFGAGSWNQACLLVRAIERCNLAAPDVGPLQQRVPAASSPAAQSGREPSSKAAGVTYIHTYIRVMPCLSTHYVVNPGHVPVLRSSGGGGVGPAWQPVNQPICHARRAGRQTVHRRRAGALWPVGVGCGVEPN